jgi:nicotinamide mononucleotide transporter
MISWMGEQYLEILGVFFSLLYLLFSIKQNLLLWPMGMIGAILYMVVFYQSKFYADMGLNGYYFIISIYGWVVWSKVKKGDEAGMPVTRIRLRQGVVLGMITVVAFTATGFILDRYTDSPLPYWDAFTTALSFTATWMLARKILEHWIIWVIVDVVSMALYFYRGLYPTLLLFAIYTVLAVIGYFQWKRTCQVTTGI